MCIRPDVCLAIEIAATIRFGFFVIPELGVMCVKWWWRMLPYLIFFGGYPLVPPILGIRCVTSQNTVDFCARSYMNHTKRYLDPKFINLHAEQIRNDMDTLINSTFMFIYTTATSCWGG
jgi:hypothetical protein